MREVYHLPKVEFERERCKGCELCVSVCPTKIIFMDEKINKKGYRVATVTEMDSASAAPCARFVRRGHQGI